MTTTPAARAATAKYRRGRDAAGYRQKGFWLSPAALEGLAHIAEAAGSEREAVESLLASFAPAKPTPIYGGRLVDNLAQTRVWVQEYPAAMCGDDES